MRPRDDEPYTLDDLVAHERSNMKLVALVFVGAVIFFAAKGLRGEKPAPVDGVGPVVTEAWSGD